MRTSIILSICLVALLGCASPKPAPTAATVTPAPASDDERARRLVDFSVETGEPIHTAEGKKLICKQESITNTRLKNRKVCMTQEQWVARTENARDSFSEAKRASEELPPRGN